MSEHEKCRTLRTIGLDRTRYNPRDPRRVVPEGCFLGTGLETIDLPNDFSWIGPSAFEHCARLQTVDISRTGIQEIVGSAFAGCSQLQCIKLSHTLRRIGREAFRKCSSLEVLHTPPACYTSTSELLLTVHSSADLSGWARKARKERGGGLMLSATPLKCVPN